MSDVPEIAGRRPVKVLVEEGNPAHVVQAAANRRNADLVVIGRSPRGNRRGSTSQVPTCGQPFCCTYQPASIHQ